MNLSERLYCEKDVIKRMIEACDNMELYRILIQVYDQLDKELKEIT